MILDTANGPIAVDSISYNGGVSGVGTGPGHIVATDTIGLLLVRPQRSNLKPHEAQVPRETFIPWTSVNAIFPAQEVRS